MLALDLKGLDVLVCGTGDEAVKRARQLSDHGARVQLIGAPFGEEVLTLRTQLGGLPPGAETGQVTFLERAPVASDLESKWLAVLADRNASWREVLGNAARANRVFFCAIDQPGNSSFSNVGVARTNTLQVAVSTSGRIPGIAGRITRLLQALLDQSGLVDFLEEARKLRELSDPSTRSQKVKELASELMLEGKFTRTASDREAHQTDR